ncbi:hypothetical protein H6P81_006538 [Aristolochia fimbriata]|uniref:Uncharacterized protein n=1 Tax=Aristolochia fimbriata TaxID=158543 RepID=A0AAV7EYR9_ARIFI|nr:hypothetical protein H6P81_006538 [Aristolochia fimbriata]
MAAASSSPAQQKYLLSVNHGVRKSRWPPVNRLASRSSMSSSGFRTTSPPKVMVTYGIPERRREEDFWWVRAIREGERDGDEVHLQGLVAGEAGLRGKREIFGRGCKFWSFELKLVTERVKREGDHEWENRFLFLMAPDSKSM